MIEPTRMIDECESELQRAVLAAGRSSDGKQRQMQVLVALGVGAAVATGTKTSLAMAAMWKKAMIGGVVVCGGVSGVVAYRAAEVDVSPPGLVQPFSQAFQVPEEALRPQPGDWESESVEIEPKSASSEPSSDRVSGIEQAEPPTALRRHRAPAPGLDDEIALLDAARAAVKGGRASAALVHLNEYSRSFPKGRLRLEAEVLRVEALAAAGRRDEASVRAKRLLGRSPNSVVAARLRRYVLE